MNKLINNVVYISKTNKALYKVRSYLKSCDAIKIFTYDVFTILIY